MTDVALRVEALLHLLAVVLYAASTAARFIEAGGGAKRAKTAADVLLYAGLGVHALALVGRWIGSGHGPYLTRYEVLSSNAFFTMLLFAYLERRWPRARALGLVLVPAAFLLVALGIYTGTEVKMLPPTFTGVWLVLHVCFYFLAFATGLTAAAAASVQLYRAASHRGGRFIAADDAEVDRLAYRYAGLAFAFWGVGMLTGAIWAYYSWGRFWAWDPVETWSLITWIAFALYLHVRRFWRWSGARAALVLIGCFVLAVVSLFGTSFVEASLHSAYFR